MNTNTPITGERLLALYLDPTLTVADIAFTLGLSIPDLLELVERDEFKALFEQYAAAHEARAAALARVGLDLAARTFLRIAQTCDKPETARKAAGALVRLRTADSPNRATNSLKEPARLAADSPKESVPSAAAPRPAPHRRRPPEPRATPHRDTPSPHRTHDHPIPTASAA